jgi:hypothetical protein
MNVLILDSCVVFDLRLANNGNMHVAQIQSFVHIKAMYKGHFTHEPRAMTMKLWELKIKCPKAVPRHLQIHAVWSRILKSSVNSYVTEPSTKYRTYWFTIANILKLLMLEAIG